MYLYPVGVIVQQQHSRARHLLSLHHSLQISQQTHVFGHVSGQNLNKREGERKKIHPQQQDKLTGYDLNRDGSGREKSMNPDILPCQ